MSEIRVLTIPWDPRTQAFDERAMERALVDREVIRAVPELTVIDGRPVWSVFVEQHAPPTPADRG